jgi:ABC-type sugar transport system permease subunit
LLEAARVDGASFRQQLRYVYWPMLKPITSVVVVLVIIGTSQLFAEPWLLTRGTGGPDQAGLTTAMLAYQVAFREIRYGYGAAVAYMTVLGVVAASLVALALLRSKEP